MNAMSAGQAVGRGKRALQPQGEVGLRQLLERTAGRRSFSIDAQSLRIIGQALLVWVSGGAPRIAVYPANLSSAGLEQFLDARSKPKRSQQRECANLRVWECFADASRRGQKGSTPGNHIIDDNHAFWGKVEWLQSKRVVVPRDARPPTFRAGCRFA